ncbi:casein kinase 1-like protein 9 [Lactuca sativa]|uniref:casein kinase 1-like protein 9 n=1 Tax=Lactuca sativa TaxID=4236 RepID=UPI0022B038DF|nr:casein kinase 1-like protein 9 [Lactuca sativa]
MQYAYNIAYTNIIKNKERIIDTDDVVGEKFKLGRKIGKGAFCEVYAGVILESGEEVAIKLEPVTTEHPQLYHESEIYKRLQGGVGIPSLKWFGVERGHNIMVIDLLGPNLQELLHRCGGKFSLKTVLMLADQLIEAVEFMHDKGVVHRDIKTENLLMGVGSNVCQVYLTDFGLANVVLDPETDEHIEYRIKKLEQGRRNDMESLAYVLVYFLKGSLPWQGLSAGSNEEEINGDVMRKKFAIKPEELCESCPPEFAVWITSCQCYVFDYEYDWAHPPNDELHQVGNIS